jgi:hypothetical protein
MEKRASATAKAKAWASVKPATQAKQTVEVDGD